jgi:ATP-dependent Lon protease
VSPPPGRRNPPLVGPRAQLRSPAPPSVEADIGVAFFVAAYSVLRKTPPQAGLLVLGDLSVTGNIKAVRSLVEPLQVAADNGARKVLTPIENKRSFMEVSAEVLEKVDPIFYGDVKAAAFKALGVA